MQELFTYHSSIIHQLDARVKIILTLAFIIFLSMTPQGAWPAYILFLTITLSLAILSHIGIAFVLKRSLLALPFALTAIPIIFSGPAPLETITISANMHVFFSPAGMERFASIAIKSWISGQAAILLAATTRFPDLLTAIQQFKAPKVFITLIGLMWRYLFVMVDEVSRMMRARSSRSTISPEEHHGGCSLFWRASVTGNMAGVLFLRSIERSDRIYAAMLSRGYNGDPPACETSVLPRKDRDILMAGLLLLIFLLFLGLLTGE